MKRFNLRISASMLCAALILSGFASPAIAASTANPYGASPIDPPSKNEVILTIENRGQINSYRIADLVALKPKTITIYEPFLKKSQIFSVISLKELFRIAGIVPTQSVETRALNDYIYTNTSKEFMAAQGFLAIKRDGKLIPYDQGGPIRIIYSTGSKWSHFLDPWNWSLMSIKAK